MIQKYLAILLLGIAVCFGLPNLFVNDNMSLNSLFLETNEAPFRPWELSTPSFNDGDSVFDWFVDSLVHLRSWAEEQVAASGVNDGPFPDRYFGFIPEYVGSIVPGASPAVWSTPCFGDMQAAASFTSDGASISFFAEKKNASASNHACKDDYLVVTTEGFHFHSVHSEGEGGVHWKWSKKSTADDQSWVKVNGFRVFRFASSRANLVLDLLATIELFAPVILKSPSVPKFAAEANVKFIKDYANTTMEPRSVDLLDLDESMYQDGDFLGIIRLDGLDTIQVFGTGAHTGHTAMIMHIDGNPYVLESTDKTNYWPKPHIQRTPLKDWLKLAHAADYNVRHLPLSPEARLRYNTTKALEYFNKVEGMPYGYHNFLWGWIDTLDGNFPAPLSHQLFEPLIAIVDKIEPAIGEKMWGLAFNKRLNTENLNTAQIYATLIQRSMTFKDLAEAPEQDSWVYPDGFSMVCDVFVCAMYKAGGLFGSLADSIQCTEFQNWDVETLNFFDLNYTRPEACVKADPMLSTCQIMGKYRLHIPGFGTVQPYAHMRELCSAAPPDFVRPQGC